MIDGQLSSNEGDAGTINFKLGSNTFDFGEGLSVAADVAAINIDSGTVDFDTADVQVFSALTNNATLEFPGSGTYSLNGDYVQTSAGNLIIGVTSSGQISLFNVVGNANLAGTVTFAYGPGSYSAEQLQFLDVSGTRTGTFTNVAETNLPSNFNQSVTYDTGGAEARAGVRRVRPPPPPAPPPPPPPPPASPPPAPPPPPASPPPAPPPPPASPPPAPPPPPRHRRLRHLHRQRHRLPRLSPPPAPPPPLHRRRLRHRLRRHRLHRARTAALFWHVAATGSRHLRRRLPRRRPPPRAAAISPSGSATSATPARSASSACTASPHRRRRRPPTW